LKIAHVSKSDAWGGGASRTAQDLTASLNARGHKATHFCAWAGGGFNETRRPLFGTGLIQRATRKAHRVAGRIGFPEVVPFELPMLIAQGIVRDYDVVHFHDLTTAISPLTVRYVSARRPTFWTLHDFSPVTGGCIFPFGCERYKTRCGANGGCPQLADWPLECKTDQTGLMQGIKASLHRTRRVHTIVGSNWMADSAVESGKIPIRPTVIPYSVDTQMFRPVDDVIALRRSLGLPTDSPIVLVSGSLLSDERKGIRYSLAAITACSDLSPFALVVGGEPDDRFKAAIGSIPHKATGYVSDQEELARWYAAADVFLFCSLAETGPLSAVETMACGTPFVGFQAGGLSDMVVQYETGIVVGQRDEEALALALRHVLSDGRAKAWGRAARQRAESHYSYEAYTDRHITLYEQALAT
jgi:glycosyltransferase involved in cell wall biosynthesis